MRRLRSQLLPLALVVLMTMAATSAVADSISFDLTVPNSALSGFSGPYASVTVDRTNTTHATITINSLTNGGYVYLIAGQGAAAVNVNASTWTIGTFSCSNSLSGFSGCGTPGGPKDGGAAQEDGFGNFNQTVDFGDGFKSSATTLSFILTNTGGTWANAGSVLVANAGGSTAAYHGFACATPCSSTSSAAATGYAANGTNSEVPEPSTLMMFGSGLFGAAGFFRRRFLG